MRVSNQDLANASNPINANRKSTTNPTRLKHAVNDGIVYVDSTGNETNNKQDACAFSKTQNGLTSYSVRVNHGHEPYIPNDKIYAQESKRQARNRGTDIYKLISCDKKIYDKYVRFLKSGNKQSYPKFIG